ncbi:MAG: hypothetical protein HY231_01950 [Acidobacteria bacterium]|nr:hypothetical protein [Acidobacteriota bacterium]
MKKVTRNHYKEMFAILMMVSMSLAMTPVAAFAQTETGQITVKAVDPQGAVVPGAAVSVKSTTWRV